MKRLTMFAFLSIALTVVTMSLMSTDMSDEELLQQAFEVHVNRNRFFTEIDARTGFDDVTGTFYNNRLKLVFPVINLLGDGHSTVETSSFAAERVNSHGRSYWHSGVDISYNGTMRDPTEDVYVVAAVGGVVETVVLDKTTGYGTHVKIKNTESGIVFVYAHLAKGSIEPYIVEGAEVSAGQKIAVMGSTGNSTGVHLHFGTFAEGVSAEESDANIYGCVSPFDSYYFVYKEETVPITFRPNGEDVYTFSE